MADRITTGGVHHLRLTVSDVSRSVDFYRRLLNFESIGETGSSSLISNGSVMLGLGPAFDADRAIPNDRFDENRLGLDHLSFAVGSMDELQNAVRLLDAENVPHGDITDLGEAFGICILAFRDPDNIQLELTAPRG